MRSIADIVRLNLVQVINRINYAELPEMIDLAAGIGARSSFKLGDTPPGTESLALSADEKRDLLDKLIPEARKRAKVLKSKHNLDAFSGQLGGPGGERFLLNRLHEVAIRLAAAGHTVSLLTNLSVSLDIIRHFVVSADAALRTFSCSLHLEETSEADFLAKALAVCDMLAPLDKATFVVNSVVRPCHIDALGNTRRRFEATGIKFYPQLMREDGKPVRYNWLDRRRITRHFGDLTQPGGMNRGFSLTGHLCHAGHRYFIVTPKGDAYTCYSGKRFGDGYLGNLFDGNFALRNGSSPCPYAVCPCTVPQNRRIVEPLSQPS